MKQKLLYIAFVLFTIFLLILINKKSDNTINSSLKPSQQEPSLEQQAALLKQGTLPLLSSQGSSRITVVKKATPKEKSIVSESSKITNARVRPKEAPISSSSAVSSGSKGTSQEIAETPKAGITKIGKRPTPEQTSELNEQGIIVY
jgi:hypothetical protein